MNSCTTRLVGAGLEGESVAFTVSWGSMAATATPSPHVYGSESWSLADGSRIPQPQEILPGTFFSWLCLAAFLKASYFIMVGL